MVKQVKNKLHQSVRFCFLESRALGTNLPYAIIKPHFDHALAIASMFSTPVSTSGASAFSTVTSFASTSTWLSLSNVVVSTDLLLAGASDANVTSKFRWGRVADIVWLLDNF